MLKRFALALMLAGIVYTVTPSIAQTNGGNSPQSEPGGVPADHGRGGHFDPAMRAEMLAKHLNLTSDQQAKVLDIIKAAQSKVESLHSDRSTPPQERRPKMMEIHREADEQIRAVLNSEQQEKWDAMQSRREQGQGRGPGGQTPPPTNSPE
jgi:Spy/CpxP family protein refolding chaperone